MCTVCSKIWKIIIGICGACIVYMYVYWILCSNLQCSTIVHWWYMNDHVWMYARTSINIYIVYHTWMIRCVYIAWLCTTGCVLQIFLRETLKLAMSSFTLFSWHDLFIRMTYQWQWETWAQSIATGIFFCTCWWWQSVNLCYQWSLPYVGYWCSS